MADEPIDYNAFNAWDSFGATLMLGISPAIINYVFNEHDIGSSIVLAVIGIIVSLVVLLLALITRWKIIGTLVNLMGWILTILYGIIGGYMWYIQGKDSPPKHQAAEEQKS